MKHKKLFLLLPELFLLCSCNIDISSEAIMKKLIPNWISFVVQLGALIVMIIVIILLAYKPVKKIIKKRQDYIESNIHESEINKAQAIENNRKSEETLLATEKKASEMIEEAKKVALKERETLIAETSATVSNMKKAAEEDIKLAKEEAKEEISKEIVDVALLASSEVLKREVNHKDNEKLVDDFIKEIQK